MKRTLYKTGDGSLTLHIAEWNEQYHSKHGAIAEAHHVFIKEGLYHWLVQNETANVDILEIGFGTGLNCFLSYLETEKHCWSIDYTGIEGYPLGIEEVEQLNYTALLKASQSIYMQMHKTQWEVKVSISDNFQLTKLQLLFTDIAHENCFDLVYFDAFGIRVQPELWNERMFQIMFDALRPKGVLVTYAANGTARRAMQAVGFEVERLPGPPGKKEMLRATKF